MPVNLLYKTQINLQIIALKLVIFHFQLGAADAAAAALEAVHGTAYRTGRASDILCE